MQTFELLQATTLSEDKRGEVARLYALELLRRMLKFHDAHLRAKKARMATVMETSRIEDAGGHTVPFVIGLTDDVEVMLIEAKSIIRDTLGLFEIFFGKKFAKKEASRLLPWKGKPGEVLIWTEAEFGPDSKIHGTLQWYQALFHDVVTLRNAAEHPEDKAGNLIVENFRRGQNGLVAPTWRVDGGPSPMPEAPLFPSLQKLEDGLLYYCEDILAACVLTQLPSQFLFLAEIPAAERKAEAPVRLQWRMVAPPDPAADGVPAV
jgi:hypothetical protein